MKGDTVTVDANPDGDRWMAWCTCGWSGKAYARVAPARRAASAHYATCVTGARVLGGES